jgi:hypothetical protein
VGWWAGGLWWPGPIAADIFGFGILELACGVMGWGGLVVMYLSRGGRSPNCQGLRTRETDQWHPRVPEGRGCMRAPPVIYYSVMAPNFGIR